jgi:hypothetical protein
MEIAHGSIVRDHNDSAPSLAPYDAANGNRSDVPATVPVTSLRLVQNRVRVEAQL